MIDIVINAKEAVMRQAECRNSNRCILGIMSVNIKLELTTYLLGIDDGRHIAFSLVKQCQHSFVNIVVDKDNALLGTLNQVGHEGISIINLPIVKHTLVWFCITLIQSAEHFINAFVGLLQVSLHLQLMVFHCRKALKYICIYREKTSHGNKCIHNTYAYTNSRFTSENGREHCYSLFCKSI